VRSGGKPVASYQKWLIDFTIAQDLNRLLDGFNQPCFKKFLWSDFAIRSENCELAQVYNAVFGPEYVSEASLTGQAFDKG
jgi:hypothetical protein